jgi:hypothetical protein
VRHWLPPYVNRRRSVATLDQPLVLATWWVITRSMVVHAVILSALLAFAANEHVVAHTASYQLLLHWAPFWVWSVTLCVAAVTWWLTRGVACILAGVAVAAWFFALACAYFVAWVSLSAPGTTVTGWVTYGFLGWAWMCVTYVVWQDEEHVRVERAQVHEIELAVEVLHADDP